MTQAELARAAGVSEPTLSHAATGRSISYLTIRKLARALALTPVMPGADGILGVYENAASGSQPRAALAEREGTLDATPVS